MALANPLTAIQLQAFKQRFSVILEKPLETGSQAIIFTAFYLNYAVYLFLSAILTLIFIALATLAGAYLFIFLLFTTFSISNIDGLFAFFGGIFVTCTWQLWVTNIIGFMEKCKKTLRKLRRYRPHEAFYTSCMYPSEWIALRLEREGKDL